ncbi:hypothetical protein BOTBODRAFT_51695 [Botryobasidium botryosum FD-172 SS1]|uniref:RNI-like protein n=1 Tax=Botryobasidium botryosum (strain FD-172 SS1) TaxID=930990 RepID=A0A067MX19_BOTB1|nr:hypothetical protein BOTBODRAFT_51695 [Botryobasidium botryosum FD-172 SS1]
MDERLGLASNIPLSSLSLTSLELSLTLIHPIHSLFPHLRTLLIHENSRFYRGANLLRHLVEHSLPPLVSIVLISTGTTDGELCWCLERLPLIQKLDLIDCLCISDTFLEALSTPGQAGYLAPQLKQIGLSETPSHITPGAIVDMLSARCNAPFVEVPQRTTWASRAWSWTGFLYGVGPNHHGVIQPQDMSTSAILE